MSHGPSFWNELKERRVVRVALVYLAVAWGVFEGSDTLTSVLGLPEVTPRVVFALALLGFPVAVVLAWAYQLTPDGVERADASRATGRFNLPFLGGLAVGIVTLSGLAFVFSGLGDGDGGSGGTGTLDANAVAVLPFRVNAPDELSYLGSGFMDLLAARFDGEVGPRAIDPGAVVTAMSGGGAEATSIAVGLNAGRVLTGSVVGSSTAIVVNAEFRDVSDGTLLASAVAEGSPDSLSDLADQIIVQLLSLSSGEYSKSIVSLTSTDPQALREYLLGRQAWREGRYVESATHFDEALAHDSTFALAALSYVDAATMGVGAPGGGDKPAIAWRHRDRLSDRDLTYLEARLPQSPQTHAERLATLARLTSDQPDRVEAWYLRGDILFHATGMYSGAERMEQVWAIWGRTLELDPAYTPVYDHLIIGGHLHASPEQRRDLFRGYTQQESSTLSAMAGEVFGPIINGGREFVLNPETIVALDGTGLGYMTWLPVYAPDQMPDDFMAWVEAGLQERRQRAVLQGSLSGVLSSEYSLNLVLGRPGRAAEVREEALAAGVWPRLQRRTIYDALWEGVALEDAEASVEMADARIAALNGDSLSLDDALDVTVAEIWRHQSDPSYTNPSAAARIRAAAGYAAYPQDLHFEFLAQLLEEWDHVRAGSPAAAPDRLFSILDRGLTGEVVSHSILFAAAQVFEEAGDLEGALQMLDRTNFQSFLNQRYATRLWRESGRLASLTGDAPRAIQEYRRWLTLHLGAEPSVMPEVEAVRADVGRLGG